MKAKLYDSDGDPVKTVELQSKRVPPLLVITREADECRYWSFTGHITNDVCWYHEIVSANVEVIP